MIQHKHKDHKRHQFTKRLKRIRTYRKSIIVFSVLLNVFLLAKITNTKVEKIIEREYYFNQELIDKVYNLKNYESFVDSSSDLEVRFNRLYKIYLKDKDRPKKDFYNTQDKIYPEWEKNCTHLLRKIHTIDARIQTIENSIEILLDNRQDVDKYFSLLVQQKQYKEKLAEMSNFYAKFISNDVYDRIIQSLD